MPPIDTNTQTYTLNDGNKIPAVALGTWRSENGDAASAVKTALQNGYKHIDTASIYGNEEGVGQGIKESGVKRENFFLTTKLWNPDHKNPEAALDESLRKLGTDYVDLYLIHWPVNIEDERAAKPEEFDLNETYKALQPLVKAGKVKSIGISNVTKERVQKLLADKDVTIKPVVNQIEAHPLLTQPELFDYLQSENIFVEAYSPLGSEGSPLLNNPVVKEIAKKNNADVGQVLVSWAVQRKTIVLPKSVHDERIISNHKTFTLKKEDFEALNNLSGKYGVQRTNIPPWNVF
ncbi:hypothetical protein FT663_00214 [Candidozyma haemuli var. vulneris]|uniref:2-dehydropantolactone reductase n=1 Tax=Candidozyma haemuli TaxID=45357 RepID=A0A2V1AQG4_9ASCO|nr:hypothetical protein CXQ85_003604 [[Candida] haemuloni]KAF3993544.1 hypothetical protein FT662_00464 [[Candida] haemuloni var. vulneris]KAF3995618.1 hypothetical protein FT663_00214 [[Candida] haemuloni var. vulneris]PVH19746.1 hypothetical protein CXQ85_003604 [[Candida] haemuloni]